MPRSFRGSSCSNPRKSTFSNILFLRDGGRGSEKTVLAVCFWKCWYRYNANAMISNYAFGKMEFSEICSTMLVPKSICQLPYPGLSIALNMIHPVFFPLIWAHLKIAHYTPQW
jgi:hypothetical protein